MQTTFGPTIRREPSERRNESAQIRRRGTVTAETGGRVSTRLPEHIQLAKIRRRGCSKMIPGSEKHATAPGVGVEQDNSNNRRVRRLMWMRCKTDTYTCRWIRGANSSASSGLGEFACGVFRTQNRFTVASHGRASHRHASRGRVSHRRGTS
jgi:hypothetical protein